MMRLGLTGTENGPQGPLAPTRQAPGDA
jgi:hypothetical protein